MYFYIIKDNLCWFTIYELLRRYEQAIPDNIICQDFSGKFSVKKFLMKFIFYCFGLTFISKSFRQFFPVTKILSLAAS